jgi:UDP-2,3-diacylglucosamine hydrolase
MQATEHRPAVALGRGDRVGIVAGSGRLPVNVAEGLKAAGHSPFIVIAGGERTDLAELTAHDHAIMDLERLPEAIALFKRHGVTHIVLAGGIGRRPLLSRMRPSWALLSIASRLAPALARGDNALLATLVRLLEDRGFKVVGAHEVVPDLLAEEGIATESAPTAADRRDLNVAFAAAKAIGALDIGQAAVAIGGRVIAVEDIEGTDGLLARVKTLRTHPRLAGRERGVIVKCAKPGQELRADLPSIGPQTVAAAREAGLAGIGVEAGRSLVLDHAEVVSAADRLGLFVVGLAGAPA